VRRKLPRGVATYPSEVPLTRITGLRRIGARIRMERNERRAKKAFRQAPFPLYGLPTSWVGLRLVGGWGWSSGIGATSLSLMHRSRPGSDASQIVVAVCRRGDALNFHKAEIEEWVGLRDDFEGEPIRESEWKAVQIPVAGQDFDFEMIRGEDARWGALSSQGDLVIQIEANHFPIEDLSLIEITDVEPYLRGQDDFMRTIRRGKAP
jgi:hypothetical protein